MTMIRTSTPVETGKLPSQLGYKDCFTLLGSCFSDEIAGIMDSLFFNMMSNPTGTLYNPASIAAVIRRMDSREHFTMDDVEEIGNGIAAYSSFWHHSRFADTCPEEFLSKANDFMDKAAGHFGKSSVVIVTFGTSWAYRHEKKGIIVANCLKHDAREFKRFFLSPEETARIWSEEIIPAHKDKTWIFTVSPIRHLKDGLHGNALSKAALLAACEEICSRHSSCHYFPAFEIMNDELRDYRYYADDLVHPSTLAVRIIWEKFRSYAFTPETVALMDEAAKIRSGLEHRPLFPGLQDNAAFHEKYLKMKEDFLKKVMP